MAFDVVERKFNLWSRGFELSHEAVQYNLSATGPFPGKVYGACIIAADRRRLLVHQLG